MAARLLDEHNVTLDLIFGDLLRGAENGAISFGPLCNKYDALNGADNGMLGYAIYGVGYFLQRGDIDVRRISERPKVLFDGMPIGFLIKRTEYFAHQLIVAFDDGVAVQIVRRYQRAVCFDLDKSLGVKRLLVNGKQPAYFLRERWDVVDKTPILSVRFP